MTGQGEVAALVGEAVRGLAQASGRAEAEFHARVSAAAAGDTDEIIWALEALEGIGAGNDALKRLVERGLRNG